jgi:hypothetical protein
LSEKVINADRWEKKVSNEAGECGEKPAEIEGAIDKTGLKIVRQ